MKRIVKAPEIRHQEIMQAPEELLHLINNGLVRVRVSMSKL